MRSPLVSFAVLIGGFGSSVPRVAAIPQTEWCPTTQLSTPINVLACDLKRRERITAEAGDYLTSQKSVSEVASELAEMT